MAKAEIRIGTSGWNYRHWVGPFYPEHSSGSSIFPHYVAHFDTVEVNNSFYRIPQRETLRNWRKTAGDDFCFALKASRYITHNKKLKDCSEAVKMFLSQAEELDGKLGPVLFQLPPHWKLNLDRLAEFFQDLPKRHRYAFEFRETSWNTPETMAFLRRHNAALCIYHLAGFLSPIEITADWTYVRLHGPDGKYQGRYSSSALRGWARRIEEWSTRLKAIYVYFDNDDSGFAALNALELKRLVDLPAVRGHAKPSSRQAA